MTHKKSTYERLEDRAERGEYTLVEPLDYLILDALEEEGATFAGLYPLATNAGQVAKIIGKGIDTTMIGTRLGILRRQGLVKSVQAPRSQQLNSWQRTALGKDLLNKWKESNGNS